MKKILYGLLVILMMGVISGCGKNNELIGTYHLIEMKSNGETYSKRMINTLGLDFTLEIKEGNKAMLVTGNERLEFSYDEEKFVSKNLENNEEEVFSYVVNNEIITLNYNDEIMIFEKSNK